MRMNKTELLDAISVIMEPPVPDTSDCINAFEYSEAKGVSYSYAQMLLRNKYKEGKLERFKTRNENGNVNYHYRIANIKEAV